MRIIPASLVFLATLAFAADPPQLPPSPIELKFKDQPYRVGLLLSTNRPHCTTNCPPAKTRLHIEWDHYGPGSQFISFELWGQTNAALPEYLVAKTTNTYWERTFTNGPMLFIRSIYAIDKDMARPSKAMAWRVK